jgi:hypothetical protein
LRPNFKSSEQPPHSKPSLDEVAELDDENANMGDGDDEKNGIDSEGVDELIGDFKRTRERIAADEPEGGLLSQPHSVSSPLEQALAILCMTEAEVSA